MRSIAGEAANLSEEHHSNPSSDEQGLSPAITTTALDPVTLHR